MERSTEQEDIVIRGTVRRVTYRNDTNGYAVLQVAVEPRDEQLTVVGTCPEAHVGTHLMMRGCYVEHPKFGRQFSARAITETAPSDPAGLVTYLGSGIVKGIGEKTAQKLVDAFGTKVLEVISREPQKVAAVLGVGRSKAEMLNQAFTERDERQEIVRFLIEHNLSQNLAAKIIDRYGTKAVEVLKRDPYLLARSGGIRGVGFTTADHIAMNLGMQPDAPQRLTAGIYYALEKAADEGHCYLDRSLLFERARVLLQVDDSIDLSPHLEQLAGDGFVRMREDRAYLQALDRAEEFVAQFAAERSAAWERPLLPAADVGRALERAGAELQLTFSAEQRAAVQDAVNYPLLLITGGPGCGKTTVIRALASLFTSAGKRLALAAPTGRAAQRMAQVCTLPAKTIHRLLRFDPLGGGFLHNANEPLPIDALIVDEASMIDISLARDLFAAVPREATVILVGDRDQLPSVGPGRVFAELLSLRDLRTVALSRLFRRSEESQITEFAHIINTGAVPPIPEPDGVSKGDAYFIPRATPEEAAATIEALVADQIPKKFGFNQSEISVLTPSNRGPLGTQMLNARLQQRLNPQERAGPDQEIELHGHPLRLGDRVCQRVNNYQLGDVGVFNGDVGIITEINRGTREAWVEMWDGRLVRYDSEALGQLSLAYAITVHRSQGSEMPCVILALHESHFTLLERQLTYTAVTRAKSLLVIVGSRKALALACKRTTSKRRCTGLRERIEKLL